MKRVTALFLSLLLAISSYAQSDTIQVPDETTDLEEIQEVEDIQELEIIQELDDEDIVFETPDKTEISFGKNEVFIIEESGDTTIVQLGSKGLSIVEGEDGTSINIIEMEKEVSSSDTPSKKKKTQKKFKPHYAGLELGMNNFMDANNSLANQGFMNLNTGKSWNFNLNFLEYGFGLGTSYAGLVTGLGVEWSSYVFDANNTIAEDDNGDIIGIYDPFVNVTKSSLKMSYLTVPLLLEFQIPAGKKRIHLSAGVVGGVKMTSKTKVKYQDGGNQKSVIKDDFSLSPFRYGATVRLGYRAVNIFANYYFSPLFSETATPELFPISIGLNIIPF